MVTAQAAGPTRPVSDARLLLLLPTKGYRGQAFMDAAAALGVNLTIASEEPSSLEALNPGGLLSLDFARPADAAKAAVHFAREYPLTAVVGVDDATAALQAAICEALGLPSNPPMAVAAARDKYRMRCALAAAGIDGPSFRLFSTRDDPAQAAPTVNYPCVLKPLTLSGSRGVIRADDEAAFVDAFRRIRNILQAPDLAHETGAERILVEDFIPGREAALEALLMDGELHVLALFDKPDPLDGPYFEESLYTTPSRLSESAQQAAAAIVGYAAAALGLNEGPIHAELRVENDRPVILEINPRSIGGRCSRMLHFGTGMSLEELILRRA
ncbi:MAG: ATP-grasp domain-containing protein, partial [Chloroflexi bacterium]|nr:ATP-grasp domain-containing protein [Chloroflexota bacterium]